MALLCGTQCSVSGLSTPKSQRFLRLALESRGPGIDPFRAGGPKWGRKWPKNGFWPHLKNGGKMARKMEKMAPKWFDNGIPGHFPHFPGHASPIFLVRPKSIFRPFPFPFRAGGPKWIYTRSTGFQGLRLTPHPLKTLASLNKEVRPFFLFLSDNSIWSFSSVSSLSDYSIWRS